LSKIAIVGSTVYDKRRSNIETLATIFVHIKSSANNRIPKDI
jgi:hypothetical protein